MSQATIGSALVERRRELGLEKGQAADKIGMSRTTYSSYEQDAQRPSVDVFPALAGFLDVSMEVLLTLYGATCVAAVRPTLEKVLSNHDSDINEAGHGEAAPSRSTEHAPVSSSELQGDRSIGSFEAPDEAVIEPPSTPINRDSHNHESAELRQSEGAVASVEALALSDPDTQWPSDSERTTQPEESPEIRKVVRPASSEFSTSIFSRELSDGSEQYPDPKKKKKKKKKKK
jgi:transcriptional regulator with XRE-family HTH domain